MYKILYKWHKWIGLAVCVPLILWALSALLIPTLRLSKPLLDTDKLMQQSLAAEAIVVEPGIILERNGIKQVKNVRIVTMHDKHYYRVNLVDGKIVYFNTQTGDKLIDGEQRYAEYLARHYLGEQHIAISSIEPVREFNGEYRSIKRFLPVWRVSFLRDDGIRLYVDTESSRLADAVDNLRAELLWWFDALHNWSFLDKGSLIRITIFLVGMLAMFIIGLTGLVLYGLRYQCIKKAKSKQSRTGVAYYHRTPGLLISLSALMFSFSGGMHVWHKLNPDRPYTQIVEDIFTAKQLDLGLKQALYAVNQHGPVQTVSLVKISNEPYYRFNHVIEKHTAVIHRSQDEQGITLAHWPTVSYIHSQSGVKLADADLVHAQQLASRLSGRDVSQISSVQPITRFNAEYRFMDRRIPVAQVQFNAEGNPAYYVDLTTGRLAAKVDDYRRFEKFTFRMLHMWHFADGLGKNGRDVIITVFILLNVVAIILGVMLFISRRRRKKRLA